MITGRVDKVSYFIINYWLGSGHTMIYSLLFVDDDEEICTVAKTFLEKTDAFKVVTADSVKQSYNLLKNNHYDAIISDFSMPEEDGISFLRGIRNEGNKIPFVILTGMGNEDVIMSALNNGADLYFVKEKSPKKLFSLLTEKLIPLIKSKQAEIVFHEIFNQSPIAILLYNSDGELMQVNPACLKLFEISDKAEIKLFDTPDEQSIPEDILEKLKAGEIVEYTILYEHNFGKLVKTQNRVLDKKKYINILITPISLSYPTINGGYLVQILDLTEQKRSEYALKNSEERYRSFFLNSHSVMFIIHPETGQIMDANTAASSYYGNTYEELVNKNISEIPFLNKKELLSGIGQAVQKKRSLFFLQNLLSSGEIRDVEIHCGPILIENQEVLYLIIHDITEKKLSEEALVVSNKKLNMLSSITRHDILNVLTALIGYLEFASTETSIIETRTFIMKAQIAARSIRHHIEFTRDYQDLGTKEPVWHDIRAVLKNSASLINNKQVNIFLDDTTHLVVLADPLLLKVIYNLMENAIRHGRKTTKITSSWYKEEDGTLKWIIEDDGVGIPVSQKKSIFSREVGSNTGLGLFLAREILAITGITIYENGIEGEGARFIMTVPYGKYRIE